VGRNKPGSSASGNDVREPGFGTTTAYVLAKFRAALGWEGKKRISKWLPGGGREKKGKVGERVVSAAKDLTKGGRGCGGGAR